MSKEGPKSDTSKVVKPLDMNDVEMVFGTPPAAKVDVTPDVHSVTNEKDQPKIHKTNPNEMDPDTAQPTHPLLEPDRDRQKPPLAGPEIDDLDPSKPADATPYPGIDDGLLENSGFKPIAPPEQVPEGESDDKEGSHDTSDEAVGTEDGMNWHAHTNAHGLGHDETDFYYGDTTYMGNGLHNRLGGDDRPISPLPNIIPDVNTYQQKKNLAQGMMDLALLSANANQLRYVLEASSARHPYFYPSIVFITCSILLQIAVGVGLILNSRYDVKDEKEICKADKINNMTVIGIFLITIVNVFITSFSVAPTGTLAAVAIAAAAP